jgi:hypothetical protein
MEKIQTVSSSRAPIWNSIVASLPIFRKMWPSATGRCYFLVPTVTARGEINLSEAGPQEPLSMIV